MIDQKEGIWSRYKFYQVGDFVFEFLYHEDLGNCLRLQQLRDKIRDYENHEKLRAISLDIVENIKFPPPMKEIKINNYISLQLYKVVEELVKSPNLKEIYQERRKKMLADKIDVTAFMVWFIENYPESAKIMKENPDYQYNFKIYR